MLFGNNVEIDTETRKNAYQASVEYGKVALEKFQIIGDMQVSIENHDDRGILTLFNAYITRNIYITKRNQALSHILLCLNLICDQGSM